MIASSPKLEPIGQAIRERREAIAMTLASAAKKSGVSKPYLSLIETQKNDGRISDEVARAIAGALRMDESEVRARCMAEGILRFMPLDLWPVVRDALDDLYDREGNALPQ